MRKLPIKHPLPIACFFITLVHRSNYFNGKSKLRHQNQYDINPKLPSESYVKNKLSS